MPPIISQERFKSRFHIIWERYQSLKEKHTDDIRWKKIGRTIKQLKNIYGRDKLYAVKFLNILERYQLYFSDERNAVIVQSIELLKKLILHKKLNGDSSA